MDTLIFDLEGKFAHFRKYYTNSSSLTYTVPPRTTICGLLAAILGLEEDSYYEDFSSKNLNVAVRPMSQLRRMIQTVNYIRSEGTDDKMGDASVHTQVPLEILCNDDGLIKYRIYVSGNKEIVDSLYNEISKGKTVYPLCYGIACFKCVAELVARVEAKEAKDSDLVYISSVIGVDKIVENGIKPDDSVQYSLIREKMPADFGKGRTIKEAKSYLLNQNCVPIRAKLDDTYVNLKYDGIDENIVYM